MKNIFYLLIFTSFLTVSISLTADPYKMSIDPGKTLVFKINDGSMDVTDSSSNFLTEAAAAALLDVPVWLRADLTEAFRHYESDVQDTLAALILESPDKKMTDEIGFVIAHLAPEDVEVADLDLITKNAELIYDAAETLLYVDITEEGEGDERYTTLTYHMDGISGPWEWTLDRDDYYWWVVHPQFDDGFLQRINPITNLRDNAPDGWFFREYLWDGPDGSPSHQLQIALRRPKEITDTLLADIDFETHGAAYGILKDFEVDPIVLVRGKNAGGAVMTTQIWGDSACCSNSMPSSDGWVYATTIPLEEAAANGDTDLLKNFLTAGGGNRPLSTEILTNSANLWADVLIIRDRIPFNLSDDPNETLLTDAGYTVKVISSDDLSATSLVVVKQVDPDTGVEGDEYETHYLNAISKVILASDQPYSFYETIASQSEKLETFVDYGGILQMNLATRESDDWSGLRMPTGIFCDGQTKSDYLDELEVYGYPDLKETMADAVYLWDGKQVDGENGGDATKPLPDDATAMSRLGWWVEQNIPYWTSEQRAWTRTTLTRSPYAATILWNHFGNCGELQDVTSAAGRTALLPIKPTSTPADDHVINEFLFDGDWYPYMANWSDVSWFLDDYANYFDKDTGGSKTVSGVIGMRGDGFVEDLLGRYEVEVDTEGNIYGDYSRYVTLKVKVEDKNGNPVDGARIMIATNSYYDAQKLIVATWGFTGTDGIATMRVGEENNYYIQVSSTLGSIPGSNSVDLWLTDAETAEYGKVFEKTVVYENKAITFPEVTAIDLPDAGDNPISLLADVHALREVLRGQNILNERTFFEPVAPGAVDLYIVDEENLTLYQSGNAFSTVFISSQTDTKKLDIKLPSDKKWYLILSNEKRTTNSQTMEIAFNDDVVVDGGTDGGEISYDTDAKKKCDCQSVGSVSKKGLLSKLSILWN